MSPTPYMQMISPYGAHLNTPHPLLTESRKLWTRYSNGQMTEVLRSDQWNKDTGHSFLPLHLQTKSHLKAWGKNTTPSRDSHLSPGKPHIEDMETKGIKKLAILKILSGIHWGANSKILKTVYMGAVQPSLEYGASTWATAATTHTSKLDKVQNIDFDDNPWCHENHSHSWNGENCWKWTTWEQETSQTYPCRKHKEDARPSPAPKAQRPHKKTDWKGKVWTT